MSGLGLEKDIIKMYQKVLSRFPRFLIVDNSVVKNNISNLFCISIILLK